MNNLMIFENKPVEVFEWNGQVLFNHKHVGECLGIKNVNDNIRNMNEKQVVKLTNSKIGKSDFRKLHNTGENFLTESGVYKLIFKSKKKEAERFQDWVTDEVLPQIRRTGSYKLGQPKPLSAIDLFETQLSALKEVRGEVQEVRSELEEFKEDLPLIGSEPEELQKVVKRIGTRALGGYKSPAYCDKSISTKVYKNVWKYIKDQFNVNTYKAIKRKYLDKAKEIAESYEAPFYLQEEIDILNNQGKLEV